MKNVTLKEISLYAALIVAGCSFGVLLILFLLTPTSPWLLILVASICAGAASFFALYILVNQFIYRKIKVIYKIIHHVKAGKTPNTEGIADQNIDIEHVEQEVKNYTARKSAEIEELHRLEEYRKEFLGNVSHELKTPIFNTQGYLETLLGGGIDDPTINKSYLLKATKNLDRLNTIVEDLILISQYESKDFKLQFEKFDIVQLIHDVIEAQEMAADIKDVSLQIKKGSPSHQLVYADQKRIEQVLTNLVSNSIKYGNEEGKVLIGLYDMDKNILIEITDNGPGIEEHHLSRLFERFYRIDKSRARQDGGTGLGLAICKHIIEAHKQTIHVRSAPGIGTTFGFTLQKG